MTCDAIKMARKILCSQPSLHSFIFCKERVQKCLVSTVQVLTYSLRQRTGHITKGIYSSKSRESTAIKKFFFILRLESRTRLIECNCDAKMFKTKLYWKIFLKQRHVLCFDNLEVSNVLNDLKY